MELVHLVFGELDGIPDWAEGLRDDHTCTLQELGLCGVIGPEDTVATPAVRVEPLPTCQNECLVVIDAYVMGGCFEESLNHLPVNLGQLVRGRGMQDRPRNAEEVDGVCRREPGTVKLL